MVRFFGSLFCRLMPSLWRSSVDAYQSVLRIGKRVVNRGLKPLSPRYKRIVPFLRQGGNQLADKCLHTPHSLYAVGTIETNFIESQEKKVLPARKWNQHAEIASAVEKGPNFQAAIAKAQEIFNLVQGL